MNNFKIFGAGIITGLFVYNSFIFIKYNSSPLSIDNKLKSDIIDNSKSLIIKSEFKGYHKDSSLVLKDEKPNYYLVPASKLELR